MEIPTRLDLSYEGYTFASISKCRVFGPNKTFSGVEIIFELTIDPTNIINGKNAQLDKLIIDLFLIKDSSELYFGQLKDRDIAPTSLRYSRGHQKQIEISTDSFLKLVDETHYKDLELKLRAQAVMTFDKPVNNSIGGQLTNSEPTFLGGETSIRFPHSEWLKILNNTSVERFDVITLRTALSTLPNPTAFSQAFDKLKEAQDKFNRGDWNAVGAACRSAFRTLLHLANGEKNPIQKLLSPVLDDPNRTQIATALIPVLNILNVSTHQEGKSDLPPANFQREDALLCLHLTSAAISYIATVHKI